MKVPFSFLGFEFLWYDAWMGAFYDRKHFKLYIAPLPCCVFKFQLPMYTDGRSHRWTVDPDGIIDISAWSDDNGHHGPECEECGYHYCWHCHDECPATFQDRELWALTRPRK